MQRTARLEHAANLAERRPFRRRRQVVEHQRRENDIEGRRGVRQLIREAAIELDGDAFSLRLASRPRESLRIRIHPDDVDVRVKALYQQQEGPGAAADLENAL